MMAKAAEKKSRKSGRGPGRPKGPGQYYEKELRRQGDISKQIQLQFRPASASERVFIEEAARFEYPNLKKPLPSFLSEASLARAERVLGRLRPSVSVPSPVSVEVPVVSEICVETKQRALALGR